MNPDTADNPSRKETVHTFIFDQSANLLTSFDGTMVLGHSHICPFRDFCHPAIQDTQRTNHQKGSVIVFLGIDNVLEE